ncbi:MAG: phosphotransferase [Ottowia sp.]|nr:phosphotransferase [Ottowia sp.]
MSAPHLSERDLQCIESAQHWREGGVEMLDAPDAGRIAVKGQRAPRSAVLYRLLKGAGTLLGVPCLNAAPPVGGSAGQAMEVARLRALHAAGARVPQVLHVDGAQGFFVMQWLGGEHLADVLQRGAPQAAALWREAGDELLRVHAAGQYLGQAFARNIIVGEGGRLAGMVDFEDDPAQVMSLEDAQTRNWLEFLHGTLWMLPLPREEMDATLDAWLAAEPPAVQQRFARACQRLAWLRRLPKHRRWGRDTVALQAAGAAAHRWLLRHPECHSD